MNQLYTSREEQWHWQQKLKESEYLLFFATIELFLYENETFFFYRYKNIWNEPCKEEWCVDNEANLVGSDVSVVMNVIEFKGKQEQD